MAKAKKSKKGKKAKKAKKAVAAKKSSKKAAKKVGKEIGEEGGEEVRQEIRQEIGQEGREEIRQEGGAEEGRQEEPGEEKEGGSPEAGSPGAGARARSRNPRPPRAGPPRVRNRQRRPGDRPMAASSTSCRHLGAVRTSVRDVDRSDSIQRAAAPLRPFSLSVAFVQRQPDFYGGLIRKSRGLAAAGFPLLSGSECMLKGTKAAEIVVGMQHPATTSFENAQNA